MAWYRDNTGQDEEPDDDAIQTHKLITRLLVDLTRHYSELFGTEVDLNTALELAGIDRTAGPHGARANAAAA